MRQDRAGNAQSMTTCSPSRARCFDRLQGLARLGLNAMRKTVSSFCGRLESTTSRGLFCRLLALLLFGGAFFGTSWAQNRAEPRLPYPEGSDITYQWSYSCPSRMVCGFSCPGTGTAAHATKLTIYLGRMHVDKVQA